MSDNASPLSPAEARFHWSDLPALILFTALAAIVLLQFVSRYVLNDSVAWTEEIARYLLIAVTYAGSVIALRKGEHIFLEVLYRRISASNVKPLAFLVDLMTFAFHLVLTMLTIGLALQADQRMISINWPKSVVYWFVAAMLLIGTIIAARRLILRSGQTSAEILQALEQSAGQQISSEDKA